MTMSDILKNKFTPPKMAASPHTASFTPPPHITSELDSPKPLIYSYPKADPAIYRSNFACTNRLDMLAPIESKEEYDRVLKKLQNTTLLPEFYEEDDIPLWPIEYDEDYQEAEDEEKGLIPYCGYPDYSQSINMYLSGRLNHFELNDRACELQRKPNRSFKEIKEWHALYDKCGLPTPFKESVLCDVIRVLDYSLKKLDEKYGKHSGIVYRAGFIPKDNKQFLSTSINPKIVKKCGNQINPNTPHYL